MESDVIEKRKKNCQKMGKLSKQNITVKKTEEA